MTDLDKVSIKLFKASRRRTWQAIRFWVLIGIVGIGIVELLSSEQISIKQITGKTIIVFAGFFMFMLSIGFITHAINKYYRCPKCNTIPMTSGFSVGSSGFKYERGLILNPKICPKCKALLA
ncbi:MAG: hypothetical protein V4525_12890 [Pseudomonadota bacterium]